MAAAIAANVILFTAPMTILTDVGRFTAWAIHPSIMQRHGRRTCPPCVCAAIAKGAVPRGKGSNESGLCINTNLAAPLVQLGRNKPGGEIASFQRGSVF